MAIHLAVVCCNVFFSANVKQLSPVFYTLNEALWPSVLSRDPFEHCL